jgi:hypothetical protein
LTAKALLAWNSAVLVRDIALKVTTDRIAETPGVSLILDAIARGSYKPAEFVWEVRQEPSNSAAHALLQLGRGEEVQFWPRDGEEVSTTRDRWSSLFQSVPTWDSVIQWRAANQSLNRLLTEILGRLDRIQKRHEIRRERRCEVCFPGKD